MTQLARHRLLSLLLATALVATLGVVLTDDDARALDGPVDVVYVATGRNFPDALAGSTLAVSGNAPLLTVEATLPIPAATVAALEALDPDRIVVFGGPVAVGDDVLGALAGYARSGDVTRIAGGDRHDTAARIADALPDKVADADRLDGLDAADFLRADAADDFLPADAADDFLGVSDTAADSARLDGRDAADLRVLNLGNWTYSVGTVDLDALSGPALQPDSSGGVGATFMLPPDHAVGDPIRADLLLLDDDPGACSIRITTQGVRSDADDDLRSFVDWLRPGETSPTTVLDFPSGQGNHRLTLTLEQFDGFEPAPGTAFTFVLSRDGANGLDTCTSAVQLAAAQIRY